LNSCAENGYLKLKLFKAISLLWDSPNWPVQKKSLPELPDKLLMISEIK